MMTISRKSPLPLYVQIRKSIEQDLLERRIRPPESLPSEDDLAIQFGVSRMTVRRAIDQLVSQGRLRRVQGSGTYVSEQPVQQPGEQQPGELTRWSFQRANPRERAAQQVVDVKETLPTLRVANLLHTMPGEPVIELTIRIFASDGPFGHTVARVPKLLVPEVRDWQLGDDELPAFLERCCGLQFGKVAERVRAVPAEEEVAELLAVEPGSPLLYVDTLVFLTSGIPVLLIDTLYRGDKPVYHGKLIALAGTNE
jgi:GntR family transcriptional regulator